MKRLLIAVLTLSMMLSIVGCSSKEEEATKETAIESGDKAVEEKVVMDAKDVTVGFIYVGPIGDGGWSYSHDQGRLAVETELGVKTIYAESVAEDQSVETVMRDMIDQGANIIFATSFGYMDYMVNIAKEYPEVTFFHCSGYKSSENMANYFGRIYEPRFLSGIAAGMKTESNKIGYVAAFPIPEVIRGINAFTLGAQSVNPDVTVEVVWTSTWYDPAKEKDAAIALLDKGVDIIAQHQDTAGPQQAAEERNAFSIGYHTDMSAMAPGAYITAPVWNWAPYYIEQIKAVMEGNFETHAYWGGMNDGVVDLAPLTALAPEGSEAKITEAKTAIEKGELNVFAGPLKNNNGEVVAEEGVTLTDDELLGMNWFVEGVIGSLEQ